MTGTGAEEPNYIVLRYAEVLLMIAEAANEVSNGPTAEAYTAVNAVRARAGIPAMTPGLSHDLFRDSVFNERRWELSLEGPNGYFDSQRNWAWAKARIEQSMKFARSNSSKFPKANNTPINDKYKLMPIPQRALDLNPALRGHQNPVGSTWQTAVHGGHCGGGAGWPRGVGSARGSVSATAMSSTSKINSALGGITADVRLAIRELIRDEESALSADLHALEAQVPAGNHASRALRKADWIARFPAGRGVARRVELFSVGEPAGVVREHAFARRESGASAELRCRCN